VALLTKGTLHSFAGNQYKEDEVTSVSFEEVLDRMRTGQKPFKVE
jgi:hypothetical protein